MHYVRRAHEILKFVRRQSVHLCRDFISVSNMLEIFGFCGFSWAIHSDLEFKKNSNVYNFSLFVNTES